MSSAPRVVLYTNVVLSALLIAGGRLAPLRAAWQQGQMTPLASRETVAELMRALTYPRFLLAAEDRRELLADYLPYCTTVAIPKRPPVTPSCRDDADVPFLQLAMTGKAALSGDRRSRSARHRQGGFVQDHRRKGNAWSPRCPLMRRSPRRLIAGRSPPTDPASSPCARSVDMAGRRLLCSQTALQAWSADPHLPG